MPSRTNPGQITSQNRRWLPPRSSGQTSEEGKTSFHRPLKKLTVAFPTLPTSFLRPAWAHSIPRRTCRHGGVLRNGLHQGRAGDEDPLGMIWLALWVLVHAGPLRSMGPAGRSKTAFLYARQGLMRNTSEKMAREKGTG